MTAIIGFTAVSLTRFEIVGHTVPFAYPWRLVVRSDMARIIVPILGGALLQQVGTWAPGIFGAVMMAGISVYVFITIYNHPIVAALKQNNPAPVLD